MTPLSPEQRDVLVDRVSTERGIEKDTLHQNLDEYLMLLAEVFANDPSKTSGTGLLRSLDDTKRIRFQQLQTLFFGNTL